MWGFSRAFVFSTQRFSLSDYVDVATFDWSAVDALPFVSALFEQNGRCGYLVAPPRSKHGLAMRVSLIAARHVPRAGEVRIR